MSAEPLREQVLVALVKVLQGISVGAGYQTTPATVTREWKTVQQHNQFPVLTVVDGPASQLVIRALQNWFEHRFVATIWGYVHADDQVGRSTQIERLWADVIKAVIGKATLDGLVEDLIPDPGRETDEGTWEPFGAFAQDVTIVFHETISGP